MWEAVWPLLLTNMTVLLATMMLLWLVSLAIGDVSFVDAFWPVGFIIVAWLSHELGVATWRSLFLAVLVTIWGMRLAAHLFLRWRKVGKDPRYEAFISRQRMNPALFTLIFVFVLQGLLIIGISLPVQFAVAGADRGGGLQLLGWIGMGLWALGFLFEAIGDWQLTEFKRNPENAGKVLDKGLWRYTRHPNYFGEICVFWGLYLIAAETDLGPWSWPGPLVLTVLLVRWSGVPLLERRMRKTRPGYAEYIKRTSALVPWLPRYS